MKHLSSQSVPHRFPIGHKRTIRGQVCVLIGYTIKGRPRYRTPDGKFWTVYERGWKQ